jgi:hypothetical protein
MKHAPMHTTIAVFVSILAGLPVPAALAQAPLPTPPPSPQTLEGPPSQPTLFPPAELDRMVSPIALYPDPLLAQVLAAATFPAEIPEAARWADEHHYLTGMQLTTAIAADRLPWDPSVQALLPFPSVLDMMASTMPWTQELGEAFLAQRDGVMDAVQRMRQKAKQYGYLRSNAQITVSGGPYIEILPVNPDYIVVPYYDPYLVFGPPPPGFLVAGAIRFGFGVHLGAWFAPWGWGSTRLVWPTHTVIIDNTPWGRTWVNRFGYVHPYPGLARHIGPRLPDLHRLVPRPLLERERVRRR